MYGWHHFSCGVLSNRELVWCQSLLVEQPASVPSIIIHSHLLAVSLPGTGIGNACGRPTTLRFHHTKRNKWKDAESHPVPHYLEIIMEWKCSKKVVTIQEWRRILGASLTWFDGCPRSFVFQCTSESRVFQGKNMQKSSKIMFDHLRKCFLTNGANRSNGLKRSRCSSGIKSSCMEAVGPATGLQA